MPAGCGCRPLSRRAFLAGLFGATASGCGSIVVRTPREDVAHFPLVDVHSHWMPTSMHAGIGYSARELLDAMDAAGIRRMVVLGFGRDVGRLAREYPERFVASYVMFNFRSRQDGSATAARLPADYRIGRGTTPAETERIGGEFEAALRSGQYGGLGEITTLAHPISARVQGSGGVDGSKVSPDSPLVRRLIDLAGRYDVPINLHCADYGAREMVSAVRAHPKTRVIWAHGGSYLLPGTIRDLLADLPNLTFDLSSQNPLFAGAPAASLVRGVALDEGWRQLLEAHPDRFFFGVDFFSRIMLPRAKGVGDYYRTLLTQLTPATARAIGYQNALRAFALPA